MTSFAGKDFLPTIKLGFFLSLPAFCSTFNFLRPQASSLSSLSSQSSSDLTDLASASLISGVQFSASKKASMVEMRSTYVRSDQQGALFLPPGFRFHPTDEEVITSYLLQKFLNPSFTSRAVGEVDLNKCEPWDLPSKAKMGEKEWYFFCHKGMKYPTGTRTNRATKEGYWKATGKDKEIFSNKKPSGNLLVGTKKTLVFYMGRAPRGSKTNWVIHEFRLEGNSSDNANLRVDPKDEWVVCKVFHKKGEAKKGGAVDHSAGTTPNISSVDAGEGDDDFLDSMIDPIYFNNSASSLPANTTTINAAAPYNADYSISAAAGSSTTGSFVLPNYSLINASNQQFAVANSVPKSGSSNSSSWKNMLPAAAGPANGMGTYNNNVGLHQDDHQAVMVKTLGGVIGPDSGVSKGLPSSTMAGVPKQQNSLGVPQNMLWGYGHPYSRHLTTSSAATIGSAENLGARLVHY